MDTYIIPLLYYIYTLAFPILLVFSSPLFIRVCESRLYMCMYVCAYTYVLMYFRMYMCNCKKE